MVCGWGMYLEGHDVSFVRGCVLSDSRCVVEEVVGPHIDGQILIQSFDHFFCRLES